MDLSNLDDGYVSGDLIEVEVSRAVAEALHGVLLMDAASGLLVARGEGRADSVVLAGRVGAFDELIEYVAAELNAEGDRRRRAKLDAVCTCLEAALADG